jgi:hypothetical protein
MLLMSGISLGAIWYNNTHTTSQKKSPQQQSTLSPKNTPLANHNTQQGSPTGSATTPIARPATNTIHISATIAANTQTASSTPNATSQPVSIAILIPTPIPTSILTPVADCFQASSSKMHFTSQTDPIVPRSHLLDLTNCGGSGSTNWQAKVQSSGWLRLNAYSGSIAPGASMTIQVLTNINGMASGTYGGSIVFTAGTYMWVVTVVYNII